MSGVPPRIGRLFHRYHWQRLELGAHASVIIPTVLHWGDWEDVRWLFAEYGWDRIRDWVANDVSTLQTLPESVQVLWTLALLGNAVYKARDVRERWSPRTTVPEQAVPAWLREALGRMPEPK